MASINGDWFHSRSSSNLRELLTVRKLVSESLKPEYIGLVWSGGRRENPLLFKFASSAGIQPSTMQTKIRAMIRYGFIKDNTTCPLVWSSLGSLWNDLYTIGNYEAANSIFQLTLTVSLAFFSFNDSDKQFSINPFKGDMPLKFLFNILDKNNSILLSELSVLIDGSTNRAGHNFSYWKSDLINSGLFFEDNGFLIYSRMFSHFINQLKTYVPVSFLNDNDWEKIRDNPIIEISPFADSVRRTLEEIIEAQDIKYPTHDEHLIMPIVDLVSDVDDDKLEGVDVLSTETRYSKHTERVRNQIWSSLIKRQYNYICAIPNCDVKGKIFLNSAHIKPDRIPDGVPPHRSHILNGLCLCAHCHILFDKGYLSLTDDGELIISSLFSEVSEQNIKRVILSSNHQKLRSRNDNRMPLIDFIQYHRSNIFKS